MNENYPNQSYIGDVKTPTGLMAHVGELSKNIPEGEEAREVQVSVRELEMAIDEARTRFDRLADRLAPILNFRTVGKVDGEKEGQKCPLAQRIDDSRRLVKDLRERIEQVYSALEL